MPTDWEKLMEKWEKDREWIERQKAKAVMEAGTISEKAWELLRKLLT